MLKIPPWWIHCDLWKMVNQWRLHVALWCPCWCFPISYLWDSHNNVLCWMSPPVFESQQSGSNVSQKQILDSNLGDNKNKNAEILLRTASIWKVFLSSLANWIFKSVNMALNLNERKLSCIFHRTACHHYVPLCETWFYWISSAKDAYEQSFIRSLKMQWKYWLLLCITAYYLPPPTPTVRTNPVAGCWGFFFATSSEWDIY